MAGRAELERLEGPDGQVSGVPLTSGRASGVGLTSDRGSSATSLILDTATTDALTVPVFELTTRFTGTVIILPTSATIRLPHGSNLRTGPPGTPTVTVITLAPRLTRPMAVG
jgi:hypothetical protein